ncbi:ATP-binding protein [Methylovulum psychrotolerans]|uniref:ATP-binding protein n=1 Tax=Methylovulum psychrotolerans TaxID=1704499 RepID=UPI001BFF56FB|nr:ATP-binding protein [Methylovulum psychrotolerans]MBT9096618.1 ATP-binding protein [Methylovulum psychrotolerans]
MNEKEEEKKRPYLPREGAESPYTIQIPLRSFNFCHHTHNSADNEKPSASDNEFIGRTSLINQLTKLLENNRNRGSYLIAGYRGSGKTSLINYVIEKYKNTQKKKFVLDVKINLGHDAILDTRHVLFNIVSGIKTAIHEKLNSDEQKHHYFCIGVIFLSLIFALYEWIQISAAVNFYHFKNLCNIAYFKDMCIPSPSLWKPLSLLPIVKFMSMPSWGTLIKENPWGVVGGWFFLTVLVSYFFISLLSARGRSLVWAHVTYKLNVPQKVAKQSCLTKINSLYDRVACSLERSVGAGGMRYPLTFGRKTTMPSMLEPQIELELISILKECDAAGIEIIFIFDELDKISLSVTEPSKTDKDVDKLGNETVDEYLIRRKKRVDSLLGSLKTLITVGKAKFFFIAGRDMLDSYQAEKGSTSSLYESLFNQVFEVPSFLTDKPERHKMRLHSMIECYVCSRLLEKSEAELYWLSNILCGEILDEIVDEIQNKQIRIEEKLNLQNLQILCRLLINSLDKRLDNRSILSVRKTKRPKVKRVRLIRYKKVKNMFDFEELNSSLNEVDLNGDNENKIRHKQLGIIAKFVRREVKKLKVNQIKKILSDENKKLVNAPEGDYPFFELNTYFLYLRDQLDSEKDAEIVVLALRQFVYYLTIHSWGNCKRLAALFESFIKPIPDFRPNPLNNDMDWLPKGSANYMLSFGLIEKQRIAMGANLCIMFGHHLAHQFADADKLVVSTMAALHYCLKFHRNAFSRHHLTRMTEVMSIYSAPELNSILDTAITQVLWPYLRVIRNGMFRYRFFYWIEQEIRYIARTNDLESASYTFSLDSINEIKAHYRKSLESVTKSYSEIKGFSNERGPTLIAEINIVLGDIHFLERSYDESVIYYQTAVNAHYDLHKDKDRCHHLESLLRYVEALLKLGKVQEYRQRYDRATVNYLKAHELVVDFLARPHGRSSISGFIAKGDPKLGLFKQPYWAIQFLLLKRGDNNIPSIEPPYSFYPKLNDPQLQYRKGQLYFYLHKHEQASTAFLSITKRAKRITDDKEFESYLLPTTCINLAENFLVNKMREFSQKVDENKEWKWGEIKNELARTCLRFFKSMENINRLADFKIDSIDLSKNPSDVKEVLTLIFFAANLYEKHKLYDHAAMANIKALSLWVLMFDMLPLYHFDNNSKLLKDGLKKIIDRKQTWFDEVCKSTANIIMSSNGHSQQQAREKWHTRDVDQKGVAFNIELLGFAKMEQLDDSDKRKNLKDDIGFWPGSYLGQQLIFIRNWAFVARRALRYDDEKFISPNPSLLKPYRIPVHTTRSLIFASWGNARELLRLARFIRNDLWFFNNGEKFTTDGDIVTKYLRYLKHDQKKDNPELKGIDCYYLIVAKGIHNFYTALHYIRFLTENNQAIMFPNPAFVMVNLWRLLYRIVEHEIKTSEINEIKKIGYEDARVHVRSKLSRYVSSDIPSSHLDLDYVAADAKRQLRALSTMGDNRSMTCLNILQNAYYLNDDYEDPGFHLDWTMVQILIPSALMSMAWIEEDMKKIRLCTGR